MSLSNVLIVDSSVDENLIRLFSEYNVNLLCSSDVNEARSFLEMVAGGKDFIPEGAVVLHTPIVCLNVSDIVKSGVNADDYVRVIKGIVQDNSRVFVLVDPLLEDDYSTLAMPGVEVLKKPVKSVILKMLLDDGFLGLELDEQLDESDDNFDAESKQGEVGSKNMVNDAKKELINLTSYVRKFGDTDNSSFTPPNLQEKLYSLVPEDENDVINSGDTVTAIKTNEENVHSATPEIATKAEEVSNIEKDDEAYDDVDNDISENAGDNGEDDISTNDVNADDSDEIVALNEDKEQTANEEAALEEPQAELVTEQAQSTEQMPTAEKEPSAEKLTAGKLTAGLLNIQDHIEEAAKVDISYDDLTLEPAKIHIDDLDDSLKIALENDELRAVTKPEPQFEESIEVKSEVSGVDSEVAVPTSEDEINDLKNSAFKELEPEIEIPKHPHKNATTDEQPVYDKELEVIPSQHDANGTASDSLFVKNQTHKAVTTGAEDPIIVNSNGTEEEYSEHEYLENHKLSHLDVKDEDISSDDLASSQAMGESANDTENDIIIETASESMATGATNIDLEKEKPQAEQTAQANSSNEITEETASEVVNADNNMLEDELSDNSDDSEDDLDDDDDDSDELMAKSEETEDMLEELDNEDGDEDNNEDGSEDDIDDGDDSDELVAIGSDDQSESDELSDEPTDDIDSNDNIDSLEEPATELTNEPTGITDNIDINSVDIDNVEITDDTNLDNTSLDNASLDNASLNNNNIDNDSLDNTSLDNNIDNTDLDNIDINKVNLDAVNLDAIDDTTASELSDVDSTDGLTNATDDIDNIDINKIDVDNVDIDSVDLNDIDNTAITNESNIDKDDDLMLDNSLNDNNGLDNNDINSSTVQATSDTLDDTLGDELSSQDIVDDSIDELPTGEPANTSTSVLDDDLDNDIDNIGNEDVVFEEDSSDLTQTEIAEEQVSTEEAVASISHNEIDNQIIDTELTDKSMDTTIVSLDEDITSTQTSTVAENQGENHTTTSEVDLEKLHDLNLKITQDIISMELNLQVDSSLPQPDEDKDEAYYANLIQSPIEDENEEIVVQEQSKVEEETPSRLKSSSQVKSQKSTSDVIVTVEQAHKEVSDLSNKLKAFNAYYESSVPRPTSLSMEKNHAPHKSTTELIETLTHITENIKSITDALNRYRKEDCTQTGINGNLLTSQETVEAIKKSIAGISKEEIALAIESRIGQKVLTEIVQDIIVEQIDKVLYSKNVNGSQD